MGGPLQWVAAAAAVTQVASGVVQYRAAQKSAEAAETVADYNAKILQDQAINAQLEAAEQSRRDRVLARKFLGAQRAQYAGAGVLMAGSPLEVLGETAGLLELEIQDRTRKAEMDRRLAMSKSAMTRWEGAQLASGYRKQGVASILSTASNLAKMGVGFKQSGVI